MPSSNSFLLPHICSRIEMSKPRTILDIGIGFGKYGFLAREYTDICNGNYSPQSWQTRIDGIEIFDDYVGMLQRLIYSHIYIGDALDIFGKLRGYDLILLIDVIEHLQKKRGTELLRLIKKKARIALIATPVDVKSMGKSAPGGVYGNTHETHISTWKKSELELFGGVEIIAHRKAIYLLEMKNETT